MLHSDPYTQAAKSLASRQTNTPKVRISFRLFLQLSDLFAFHAQFLVDYFFLHRGDASKESATEERNRFPVYL